MSDTEPGVEVLENDFDANFSALSATFFLRSASSLTNGEGSMPPSELLDSMSKAGGFGDVPVCGDLDFDGAHLLDLLFEEVRSELLLGSLLVLATIASELCSTSWISDLVRVCDGYLPGERLDCDVELDLMEGLKPGERSELLLRSS